MASERDPGPLTGRVQAGAAPILVQLRQWLLGLRFGTLAAPGAADGPAVAGGHVLPRSPMGQAITYALNQWAALCVYLLDGQLSIDNNASERVLRRIAVGRANWQFLGSDSGGTTAAVLFSLLATCDRHRINPFDDLRDVLTRIAGHPHSQLADLLPHRWKPLV